MQSNYQISVVKNVSPSFSLVSSFTRMHSLETLQLGANVAETSEIGKSYQSKFNADSMEEHTFNEEVHLDGYSNSSLSSSNEHQKEIQRRRKIGLANKGRVPWNKGRKHSAETRERIRQRTIEALRDPKVRKRMSECPRTHSDQSKARIRSSLRQVWGKRLNWKRLREKFFLSWAESIAKAAKKGGSDQQELDWDSYNKIKEEIALQQLQQAADKAKAKEMAKLRAERAAQAKAEKIARLAEKRKEQEEKAKLRGQRKRMTRKSREDKEELTVAQGLKLKQRLTKIHRTKSISINTQQEAVNSQISAWEKLDLEFIKRERMRREVSLADQIRAAKNKRAETMVREAVTTSSSRYPATERSGE
ncbi:hypothetical protein L1049_001439 [Liquidambar formosana]|uniref:Nuclease associated modular domain-containing protein n=1 Tax=Liquidambar formosana TaxID=63359 RepID=A0AAP0NCT4_LIQFO